MKNECTYFSEVTIKEIKQKFSDSTLSGLRLQLKEYIEINEASWNSIDPGIFKECNGKVKFVAKR